MEAVRRQAAAELGALREGQTLSDAVDEYINGMTNVELLALVERALDA